MNHLNPSRLSLLLGRAAMRSLLAAALAAASLPALAADEATAAEAARFDAGTISGLNARNIGAATMSGRIAAIAAQNEGGKTTLFVGAASGGVWKSTDGGTTFKPVFDDQPVQSIGAIALDPQNPKTVWVGTGESWTRNSVSVGNGIYKSTDGGDSWNYMGLPESERIARVLVDPRASDTVYACVPGKLWSDSADRGLYKTTDGGKTWQLVLKGANLSTGCASIAFDPKNPDVIFATNWDFRRRGWTFRSGGEGPDAFSGSGLFRSADGGRNWTELTPEANAGFPAKPYGRIAVAVAPSDPKTVYAVIEGVDSALYVSHDGGTTWEQGDKSQWMVWRPFYFSNLIVDPINPKLVYKTDGALIRSDDGGKSFSAVGGFNGAHGDVHAVWIDPDNTQHVLSGDDGGLWLSYDGGNKWWKGDNLPISQFYHVSVDGADPYHVLGGLQDNSSWRGDSSYPGGITNSRWENLYGGDGFWMFADPTDANYVYAEYQGGNIGRVNIATHETRDIQPKPGYHEKLRWNWNTPIALSPTNKKTLYLGSQFLFRSRDHGQTWQRISPDLTSNDPEKQKQEQSGGITVDNSAAEMHTTIYSISESPKNANTIWVGTDDGNLQLTRNAGKSWSNVVANVPGLPDHSWVSWVEASRHAAGTAYAAFDRHSFGDMQPYLYRTTDYGRTWSALLTGASPQGVRGYAHVIREDLRQPNLLYLGTEFGLWVSIDGGASWAQFKGNRLPSVAVRDIAIQPRNNDLVLATHGRGIWIVDDVTPLRSITPEALQKEAVFTGAQPTQQRLEVNGGWANGSAVFIGDDVPQGAVITYYQRTRHLFGKLRIEVLDAGGKLVDELPASTRRGLNRVIWTMRTKPPRVPPAAQLASAGTQGVRVPPGRYTVRMTKNGQVYELPLTVSLDRRVKHTAAERMAQYQAALKVAALFGDESDLFAKITDLREQLRKRVKANAEDDAFATQLRAYDAKIDEIRKLIVATKEGGAITGEERLREHTDQLYGAVLSWDGRPTASALAYIEALHRELAEVEKQFATLTAAELETINAALRAKQQPELEVLKAVPVADNESIGGGGRRAAADRDADFGIAAELPKDFTILH
ncbi:MAG: hypothetical protein NVS9B10_08630 [Nevskia sp.]